MFPLPHCIENIPALIADKAPIPVLTGVNYTGRILILPVAMLIAAKFILVAIKVNNLRIPFDDIGNRKLSFDSLNNFGVCVSPRVEFYNSSALNLSLKTFYPTLPEVTVVFYPFFPMTISGAIKTNSLIGITLQHVNLVLELLDFTNQHFRPHTTPVLFGS
jgi:hypothetical protein